jgi:ferredoxin
MTLRVELDRDSCVSAGKCVTASPEFFRFDDEELVDINTPASPPEDSLLLRIARSCPSQAIHVFDGDQRIDI